MGVVLRRIEKFVVRLILYTEYYIYNILYKYVFNTQFFTHPPRMRAVGLWFGTIHSSTIFGTDYSEI